MESMEGDPKYIWTKIDANSLAASRTIENHENASKEELFMALANTYIKYNPDASWKHLAKNISDKDALEKVKQYT